MDDYEEGLRKIPDIEAAEEEFYNSPMADHTNPFANEMTNRMLYGMSEKELLQLFTQFSGSDVMVIGPWHEWRPCGIYHTMAERVIPYAARGVIWYQGESDEDHPDIYADMMEGLIGLWRNKWGIDLPFIMTQLAPLGTTIGKGGEEYPKLREQQRIVAGRVENVYLCSIGDVGNSYDIHPKEKQPVGHRMALIALEITHRPLPPLIAEIQTVFVRGKQFPENLDCNSRMRFGIESADKRRKILDPDIDLLRRSEQHRKG